MGSQICIYDLGTDLSLATLHQSYGLKYLFYPKSILTFVCLCLQVIGIFAGFGLLLLVASPFLLLATPFVLCCKCKCSKGDDDPLPT